MFKEISIKKKKVKDLCLKYNMDYEKMNDWNELMLD